MILLYSFNFRCFVAYLQERLSPDLLNCLQSVIAHVLIT